MVSHTLFREERLIDKNKWHPYNLLLFYDYQFIRLTSLESSVKCFNPSLKFRLTGFCILFLCIVSSIDFIWINRNKPVRIGLIIFVWGIWLCFVVMYDVLFNMHLFLLRETCGVVQACSDVQSVKHLGCN